MNYGRITTAAIVIFLYIFVYEFALHSFVLADLYEEHQHLLRQQHESNIIYFLLMLLGFLFVSFGFCYIFARGYENGGMVEGLRFGALIGGTFAISGTLVEYSVFPIPDNWLAPWLIGYMLQWIVAGLIVAGIYRPKSDNGK